MMKLTGVSISQNIKSKASKGTLDHGKQNYGIIGRDIFKSTNAYIHHTQADGVYWLELVVGLVSIVG
jgi:hypothetical protein